MATDANSPRFAGWLRAAVIGRNPRRTLVRIVVLVIAVFLARAYVVLPIKVSGPSMLPTYAQDGINFVNRLSYVRSGPRRGDVVAIRLAGESIMYMKRVIALPGETVAFRNGNVIIDGEVLDEPYLKKPCDWDRDPVKLEPGQYFVVGDNRSMRQMDHTFGKTDRKHIVGRILLCKNLFASPASPP